MSYPTLYLAITNHGFGHATRAISVAATLRRRSPEMRIILSTTAPQWLLTSYMGGEFIHRARSFDVGVLQRDSLTMDKTATLQKLMHIRSQQDDMVAAEVDFIRQQGVGLILADIPPLATAIARAADIPCWMMSNFGWDFIYRPWGGGFEAIADWIGECFSQCDRLFRLPFCEPMSAFPHITDVGLIGGTPRYALAQLRAEFNLTAPPERTVLLTFGGLGLEKIPYAALQRFPDWQFVAFDRQAPELPNLRLVTNLAYRPVDFMPLCGQVVSKPGFSTFSEACRLGIPIVTIPREDFAETPLLLNGIQDYAAHKILQPLEFFQGDWAFLNEPPVPPRKSQPLSKEGNRDIAQAVIEYFNCLR